MATETVSIRPQPGAQEKFLSSTADITIYGGAAGGGKSYALLLEPLRHVDNPKFGALVLRRNIPQITNVGGLWTESENLYSVTGATAKLGNLEWTFPSGATIKFDHLEHEKSKHKYQGAQIPLICFDELTLFTEGQFWYMLSRNRSTCGVRPYIRGTCNPDASSFVATLIRWWIDRDTGYPIPERSGKVRWFIRHGGELVWANDPAELREQYPDVEPKSLAFIPATLEDNPALTAKDPGYRANLQSLPYVERERLLGGNWNVVDAEGAEWPPDYFRDIWCDEWPDEEHRKITVVALDPSLGKLDMATHSREGDYSAFVAVAKGMDDRYYVDANIAKRDLSHIVDEGIEWMQWIRPDAFGCEFTGFQAVLGDLFTPQLYRVGLTDVFAIHTKESRGTLRAMGAKEVRIRTRLSQTLANGRIRLRRSPGSSLLLEQLMAFPKHKHDDGPDALEMAIRLAEELLGGAGQEEPDEVLVA